MRFKAAIGAIVVVIGLMLPQGAAGQPPAGVAEGWSGEFEHAARQLSQLADAIPAEKYSWRPAAGVRSVSEVYMHVALANYNLLNLAGVKTSVDISKMGKEPEKSLTAKNDVIEFLKGSFDEVRKNAPTLDRKKPAKFFGKEVTVDGLLHRILVHNHEHMGQLIAYARMNGVVPPWSASGGAQ